MMLNPQSLRRCIFKIKQRLTEYQRDNTKLVGLIVTVNHFASCVSDHRLILKYLMMSMPSLFRHFLVMLIDVMLRYLMSTSPQTFDKMLFESLIVCFASGWKWCNRGLFEFMIQKGFCNVLLQFSKFMWDSEHREITKYHQEAGTIRLLRYGLRSVHHAALRFTDLIRINDRKHRDHYLYDLYFGTLYDGVRKLMCFDVDPYSTMNTYYAATHTTLCGVGCAPEFKRFHLALTKFLVLPYRLECAWMKCEKGRGSADKIYQCKRCRMVNYCCRNHQKKDWAFIHSNQCLFRSS